MSGSDARFAPFECTDVRHDVVVERKVSRQIPVSRKVINHSQSEVGDRPTHLKLPPISLNGYLFLAPAMLTLASSLLLTIRSHTTTELSGYPGVR